MTKFELLQTGLPGLASYPAVIGITVVTVIVFVFFLVFMPDPTFTNKNFLDAKKQNGSFQSSIAVNNTSTEDPQNQREISNKLVILTFGDIHKNQFTAARPILNQYNFKGSFFVPCDMVGKDSRMDWKDIETLYEGHNIQAKGARNIIDLSTSNLEYIISQSKKCLSEHGITPLSTFPVPHGNAVLNSTVIHTIAKYYDMAINGYSSLMLMNCTGYEDQPQ
jgi:peptidoglycan/xylan/chitin deacetylase (PgdA/CDA1 family)